MSYLTREAIENSFRKLLEQKPLSKISVRDIVEDCGINRNTFYYHYPDIPGLLASMVTGWADGLIKMYPSINSLEECFRTAFAFALKNRRVIMHIWESADRMVFTNMALKLCEDIVTNYIATAFPDRPDDADRRIIIRFVKCEVFGMCIDWIQGGMKPDAIAELDRILYLCHDVPDLLLARSGRTQNR